MNKTYVNKRPLIKAFKFYVDYIPDWFMDKVNSNEVSLVCCNFKMYSIEEAQCVIKTPKGNKVVRGGNYIIKDIHDNLYSCDSDTFEMLYEPHTETDSETE
jgi:hypothetical protein